jgi:hypothetical protein
MRGTLALAVCVLTLATGLATALVQSSNRAEGIALDRIVQECSMIEVVNQSRMADVLAADLGPEVDGTTPRDQGHGVAAEGSE